MSTNPSEPPQGRVDESLVRSLAETVRVELSDTRVEEMTEYLAQILDYFGQLAAVDVSGVDGSPPVADAGRLGGDEVVPGLPLEALRSVGGENFDADRRLFRLQGVFEDVER